MWREAAAWLGSALCAGMLSQVPRDAPVAPAAGTAVVSGRVIVLVDGRPTPVRRARVVAQRQGMGGTYTTDTDSDGRFRLQSLPAGTYGVLIDKAGFVQTDPSPRPMPRPRLIEVADGQTANLDITMARGAAIEGRVTRETGQPAANVVVSAVRLTYGPYGTQPSSVRQARTDDRGRFRVHTLPAGEYYVSAEPDPLDLLTNSLPGDRSPVMARTYYPGTPRATDARPVTIVTSQERASIDFTIASVPAALVSGRVVHSSGNKPAGMSVRLQRVGGPPGEVRGVLSPQPDGFEFSVVPPGDYWMLASSRAASGALEFAATRISVFGQDYRDLSILTASGAACSGRVDADGAPIGQDLTVVAHQTAFELPLPAGTQPTAVTHSSVDVNGTFTFGSLFGPRVLRLDRLPEAWALKEVRMGGLDVTDTPTDFKGGDMNCALTLMLTTRAAQASGTVVDERGQPAGYARVVIFPEDLQHRGLRSRFVKSVEAGPDGRFSITGLLPAKYFIAAVDYLEDGSWHDPDLLARLQPLSTSRALAEQERAVMTVTMRSLR